MRRLAALLALLWLVPGSVLAHRASDSFLALDDPDGARVEGHWDVALDDLSYALALEPGVDGLRWGTLRAHEGEVARLLERELTLQRGARGCTLTAGALQLVELSDGLYARVPFAAQCPEAGLVRLHSRLLLEADRDHRTLVRVGEGEQASTQVLSAAQPHLLVPDVRRPAAFTVLVQQLGRGFVHIFEGADHIAFLLVLLLPIVFARGAAPVAVRRSGGALALEIAKVVSAFTLAHSLTLSLAGFGWVRVSAEVIEPAIAGSVALAALGNLWRSQAPEGALLAFALGLLHGFGFSSALSDAGLSGAALVSALLGFNLGVELGQLAIVALFVPLALFACRARWCREHALGWGSSVVLGLALVWVFQRLQTG